MPASVARIVERRAIIAEWPLKSVTWEKPWKCEASSAGVLVDGVMGCSWLAHVLLSNDMPAGGFPRSAAEVRDLTAARPDITFKHRTSLYSTTQTSAHQRRTV
jgi:hypothetical protein